RPRGPARRAVPAARRAARCRARAGRPPSLCCRTVRCLPDRSGGDRPVRPASRESDGGSTYAGLSALPGTAASAAWNPTFECVPSQNGLVVDPPHRHSANGRFAIVYAAPFQSTTVTSSPSTRYGPFCLTLIVAIALTHLLHGREEIRVR